MTLSSGAKIFVDFTWTQTLPSPDAFLEVSTDIGFSKLIKQIAARGRLKVTRVGLEPGTYFWRIGNSKTALSESRRLEVRAPARIESSPAERQTHAPTPDTTTPDESDFHGSGYIAISTMFAPYTYRITSPAFGFAGSTASTAFTVRLSGEYLFSSKWGAAFGAEDTFFTFTQGNHDRKTFEIAAKYKHVLTDGPDGWILLPKAGLEYRDYFALVPSNPLSTTTSQINSTRVSPLGLQLGFDLRRAFSEKLSLGLKLAYFYPIILTGAPTGSKLTSDDSYRNLSLGLQGLYWLDAQFGLGLGGYIEQRSISFLSGGQAVRPEQVYMDGSYFFGSLIYTFGAD